MPKEYTKLLANVKGLSVSKHCNWSESHTVKLQLLITEEGSDEGSVLF